MPETEVRAYRREDGKVPVHDWLAEVKSYDLNGYGQCLVRISDLIREGYELKRPRADTLRDGIRELRASNRAPQYRILYGFCGKIAVLTNGLEKESTVPKQAIETAIKRLAMAKSNMALHTTDDFIPEDEDEQEGR